MNIFSFLENKLPAMQVDGKTVIIKHHRSFYNGKCSSYRKKERNGGVSWLIKPIRYRIQNGTAHTISYSHQSIDEKKYMVNIEKTLRKYKEL